MSELRANTISDAAGTGPVVLTKQKAAVIYNYMSSSVVALESLNVSSTTDYGVGQHGQNFTNATDDIAIGCGGVLGTSDSNMIAIGSNTTTANALYIKDEAGSFLDRGNYNQSCQELA